MKINPEVFREYDIRGFVDTDLNNEFAYILGRAYGRYSKKRNALKIVIGRDCRNSSEGYSLALSKGIIDEGLEVKLIGMCPTPQLYFSIYNLKLDGGIQVTGSHNPPDMNGFKLCIGTSTLSGADIQELKELSLAIELENSSNLKELNDVNTIKQNPKLQQISTHETYINELVENSKPYIGKRKLKVVVDAGNGVGGLIGPELLTKLGIEVIELFCKPDGNFPNHHPDPTVPNNILDMVNKVKELKADFGIAWDGDADRIGVVDENGEMIYGDMLLLIYARTILKEKKNAVIIGDVKCSSRLFDTLNKEGAKAIMWKTGHSLIKSKLKETGGDLAGEMSGHIFFKNRYYGFDDAMYASSRFCEILSNTDKQVSELLEDLPKAYSTPEIRLDCPENIKFEITRLAQTAFKDFVVDTTDGARITFPEGWGLIRASNTQPVLVMRFEASSEAKLNEYQKIVTDKIEEIKKSLKHNLQHFAF